MAIVQTLIGNIKGPRGLQGETGAKGDTGKAATVSVGSTTTVPYGQTARVTNSGTEGAAVLNFVIPQGRPGEETTDMANLTLSSITEPTSQFPIPAIGETGSVIFGKITKWFADARELIDAKLAKANVANNLTTTANGYALDARQGKALNDKITEMTSVSSFYPEEMTVSSAGLTQLCNTGTIQTGEYLIMVSMMIGGTVRTSNGMFSQLMLWDEAKSAQVTTVYPFSKAYAFTTVYTVTQSTRLFVRAQAVDDTILYRDNRFNWMKIMKIR